MKEGHHAQTQKLPLHRLEMGRALAEHTKGMTKWRNGVVGEVNSLRVKGLSRYSYGNYDDREEESCV